MALAALSPAGIQPASPTSPTANLNLCSTFPKLSILMLLIHEPLRYLFPSAGGFFLSCLVGLPLLQPRGECSACHHQDSPTPRILLCWPLSHGITNSDGPAESVGP